MAHSLKKTYVVIVDYSIGFRSVERRRVERTIYAGSTTEAANLAQDGLPDGAYSHPIETVVHEVREF